MEEQKNVTIKQELFMDLVKYFLVNIREEEDRIRLELQEKMNALVKRELYTKRTTCERPEPANKMTLEEKKEILDVCNSKEFSSKTPSEIVPILADRGIYLASESTFYKVLREANQLAHRGRERKKQKRPISTHKATGPNQVWMWDITYLNGPIKGKYYYLHLFSDLYSRKIVGWEVWEMKMQSMQVNW